MAGKSPERLDLEERAAALQLQVPANIGDKKLAERVAEAEAKAAAAPEQASPPSPAAEAEEGAGSGAGAEGGNADPRRAAPPDARSLVLVVTGPKRGRWRAGRRFTAEPVAIPLEELSEAEQAALIADRRLLIETREAD